MLGEVRTHYGRAGRGDPLVLLHPGGVDSRAHDLEGMHPDRDGAPAVVGSVVDEHGGCGFGAEPVPCDAVDRRVRCGRLDLAGQHDVVEEPIAAELFEQVTGVLRAVADQSGGDLGRVQSAEKVVGVVEDAGVLVSGGAGRR